MSKTAIHNTAPPTEMDIKIAEALSPLINAVLGHKGGSKPASRPGVQNKFLLPESDEAEIAELRNSDRASRSHKSTTGADEKPATNAGKGKFLLPKGD
jgi:hypothetical protein